MVIRNAVAVISQVSILKSVPKEALNDGGKAGTPETVFKSRPVLIGF